MEDTWFDELARQLARGSHSRRTLLARVLRTGLAAAGATLVRAGGSAELALASDSDEKQTEKREHADKDTACSLDQNEQQRVFHATVTGRGGQLVLDETFTAVVPPLNQGNRTTATSVVISLKGATLLQQDTTASFSGTLPDAFALSSFTMTIKFGQGFKGIKQASFTSDGKTINGTIDGRAIAPFPAMAGSGPFIFADGSPVPKLEVDEDIEQAIKEIVAKAKTEAPECFAAFDPDDCQDCQDQCYVGFPSGALECAASAGAACVFTFGIGCVVGAVTCDQNLQNCQDKCYSSGGPCCTVHCPNGYCCPTGYKCAVTPPNVPGITPFLNTCCLVPPDSFCSGICPSGNSTCGGICCPGGNGACCGGVCCEAPCCKGVCCSGGTCTSTEGICCPSVQGKPVVSCKGHCCPHPEDVCTTDGICCAPLPGGPNPPISCNGVCCTAANEICAGSGCCPAGAPVCSDGSCCPQGQGACINGTCCTSPSHVCGSTCCPPFSVCCNNVCCAGDGSVCLNNTCCSPAQVCGTLCCPSGQYCQDPSTGTCATCSSGTSVCLSQNPSGPPTPVCCPPGQFQTCCAGRCCAAGQTCCTMNGVFGCYDESFCIR